MGNPPITCEFLEWEQPHPYHFFLCLLLPLFCVLYRTRLSQSFRLAPVIYRRRPLDLTDLLV